MRKVKSIIAVLLVVVLALSMFAGCEKKPQGEKKYVIGISQPTMTHPIRKAGSVLIEEWGKAHPDCEIIITDGQLKADKQIADIEDLMAKKVDILLVAAHQSPTLVPVLQQVKDAGIPIIAFDRILTDKSVQVAEIINDDYVAGQFAAEMLVEGMGESGNVVILEGPAGNVSATMRQDGFKDVIKKYPNIKIVEDQIANFQRVQAVDIFENIFQANKNINGIFCHNDEMALGCSKVLKDAGKLEGVTIVGVDGQKDMLEAIIAGEVYGSARKIVEFPYSLDAAYEYLTTGKCAEKLVLEALKVTSKNVKDVYKPDAVF